MARFSVEQLASAVEGVSFPARRWQLAAWADWNFASSELREALRHVPDELYSGPRELADLFEAIDRREAMTAQVLSSA